MGNLLTTALSNPWTALGLVLDGPLHPGGEAATERLLDEAGVTEGTRLLEVGCGEGQALAVARDRGAEAVGLDRDPESGAGGGRAAGPEARSDVVAADATHLPVRTGAVDVVLAECVLCLTDDRSVALGETHRALARGGRLALSDVVVDGDLPELPDALARPLCLTGDRRRADLLDAVRAAGFTVETVRDQREDLLAMRDELASAVDYERLLGGMGERGQRLLQGVTDLESAVEDGRVSYVSLVATRAT